LISPKNISSAQSAEQLAPHQLLHVGAHGYGALLSCLGFGAITGALTLARLPGAYPRHHLIPLSMCLFAAVGVLFSFSRVPGLSLLILVACGTCWLLSLNPSNTANQLLATDANRGRVLSVMLLAQQGGMPLGHLFAGFLTHYLSAPWVLRLMLGTLLVVMLIFLFVREPGIDNLPRRRAKKLPLGAAIWEAVTAHSHHPDYPAEIEVQPEKEMGTPGPGHSQP